MVPTAPQSWPEAGSGAPDFEAFAADGQPVRISSYWADAPLVVVFLRQLGCPFCRHYVLNLRRLYDQFRQLGANVACVSLGSPQAGKAFGFMFDLPFPLLMLPGSDTTVYKAYGLRKGGFRQLLFNASLWIKGFAALLALGAKTFGMTTGDERQLPGTFIIDPQGVIRLAYRSKDAADYPPDKLLFDTLSQLKQGALYEDRRTLQPPLPSTAPAG